MRNIIIILLLLPFIGQSQTKWRQIERSLTKWNIPAAYDSIPGQAGYAGKWINFAAYLDSINFDAIQTIDTFEIFDTNKLRISLSQDNQAAKVVTLPTGGAGIDSTIVTDGYGINVTESPANTFTVKSDTAELATQYDLTLKQDKLTSGTNIKTVNSTTLLGSGNLSVGTVTSISTSAPISGGTITSTGTIGLSYDPIYMGLDGSNRLYPLYNTATWNANSLRGSNIAVPFNPTTGQVLTYNGTAWAPATPSAAGVTGSGTSGYLSRWTGTSTLGNSVIRDDGSRATVNGAVDALYRFKVADGNVKIGDVVTGSYNRIFFGDGTFVSVGENNADDRLELRGATLSIAINNNNGTSGNVLTTNGTTASWQTPPDNSPTNEAQTITLGGTFNGTVSLTPASGAGGGSFTIPTTINGILWRTSNWTGQTLDGTGRIMAFTNGSGQGMTTNTSSGSIQVLNTGTYKIEYSGSYQTASPYQHSVRFNLYKGSLDLGYIGECRTRNGENSLNNLTSFSKTLITTLTGGDVISLYYVLTTGTNSTISFYNTNLLIQRIN